MIRCSTCGLSKGDPDCAHPPEPGLMVPVAELEKWAAESWTPDAVRDRLDSLIASAVPCGDERLAAVVNEVAIRDGMLRRLVDALGEIALGTIPPTFGGGMYAVKKRAAQAIAEARSALSQQHTTGGE